MTKKLTYFGTHQGVFQKEETKGYLNIIKKGLSVNERQSYLTNKYSWIPLPGLLLPGHPAGVNVLNHSFGLLWAFVTWSSKLTSTLKPFWSNEDAKHTKYTIV